MCTMMSLKHLSLMQSRVYIYEYILNTNAVEAEGNVTNFVGVAHGSKKY